MLRKEQQQRNISISYADAPTSALVMFRKKRETVYISYSDWSSVVLNGEFTCKEIAEALHVSRERLRGMKFGIPQDLQETDKLGMQSEMRARVKNQLG